MYVSVSNFSRWVSRTLRWAAKAGPSRWAPARRFRSPETTSSYIPHQTVCHASPVWCPLYVCMDICMFVWAVIIHKWVVMSEGGRRSYKNHNYYIYYIISLHTYILAYTFSRFVSSFFAERGVLPTREYPQFIVLRFSNAESWDIKISYIEWKYVKSLLLANIYGWCYHIPMSDDNKMAFWGIFVHFRRVLFLFRAARICSWRKKNSVIFITHACMYVSIPFTAALLLSLLLL